MNFFKNISNEIIKDLSLYNKSIAIVGGSSSLMENNYGKEIDKYDFVIRFNRAPTKGYEKFRKDTKLGGDKRWKRRRGGRDELTPVNQQHLQILVEVF